MIVPKSDIRLTWRELDEETDTVVAGGLYNVGIRKGGRTGIWSPNCVEAAARTFFPKEIEDFLFCHPDAKAAQVFGALYERYGEFACTWIIRRKNSNLSPDDLRLFCEGELAHFKIPAHFRIVDEMPMAVSGKLQEFRMREQMTGLLSKRR